MVLKNYLKVLSLLPLCLLISSCSSWPKLKQIEIKTVQVDTYTDMPDQSPKREQRFTVTPKPATADADDDFGFNETTSFFQDAQEFNPVTGEDQRAGAEGTD